MIVARRAAVLAAALLIAACGQTPVPTATPATTQPVTQPPAAASASATPPNQPSANPAAANQSAAAAGLDLPWDTRKVAAHTIECAYNGEGILGTAPNTSAGKSPGCVMHRDGPAGSSQDSFALDLDLGRDETVAAVASGTVRWAKAYPATSSWTCYGTAVAVDTAMPDGSIRTALYAHLDSASVSAGETVSAGQALGAAGDSGLGARWQNPDPAKQADHGTCAGSGVHLHLALYANAKYLVDAAGVAISPPYGGTSTEPKPWLDCHRESNLGTPPAGEDASCTGLHAGDGLTYTGPGGAPVIPPTVLSGTWVAPANGAKLTTSSLTLAAKPTVTPATLSISKVVFSVMWGSTSKTACSATKAGSGGTWSCMVDLWKIGAPLGKLTISFDVTDSAGDVAKAPAGTRTVTFAAPPPKPADASYTLVSSKEVDPSTGETDWVYKVAWSIPDEAADEITIWGVTGCYTSKEGQPCVAPGMSIPSGDRFKIGTVQGSKHSYLYRFTSGWEANWDDIMKGVLVQAHNRYGYSQSAIAWWVCFGNDDATVMCHP